MGIKEWIIPQEDKFFNMLESESNNVLIGSEALVDMLKNYENIERKQRNIEDIEHNGDCIVHDTFAALNKTFITPIDREDISALTSAMDDILDHIDGIATHFILLQIQKPEDNMITLADIVRSQTEELNGAIKGLRKSKNFGDVGRRCIEINRLENVADNVYKNSVAKLFTRTDAIEIMKLKEIYEGLEDASDMCEDAANVISDIIAKNG